MTLMSQISLDGIMNESPVFHEYDQFGAICWNKNQYEKCSPFLMQWVNKSTN